MNEQLKDQLNKNAEFIATFNPNLASLILAEKSSIDFIPSPVSITDRTVLVNKELYSESLLTEVRESVSIQNANVKRLLMQRPYMSSQSISSTELSASLIGSEDLLLIGQLPSITIENKELYSYDQNSMRKHRTFNQSLSSNNIILLGSLLIIEWEKLLSVTTETLLLVESDITQLTLSLHFFDFSNLVKWCSKNHIKFDLMYNEEYDNFLSARIAIAEHYSSHYPLAYQALTILSSPILSPSLVVLSSWITKPDGLSEYIKGYLGNDTDEYNQVLHTFYTLCLQHESMRKIGKDRDPIPNPIVIAASGPSLDSEIPELKRLSSRITLVSAGSSLGTLLRAGIKPSAAVILEMSSIVYRDLLDLIAEGHNLNEINLVASATIDPRIHSLFASSVIFQRPLSASLCLCSNEQDSILPQAGPQALNAAIEVVLKLGFRKILLVGADLGAINPQYQRSQTAMGKSPRNLNLPVPGRHGKTIMSSAELSVSKQLLENIIHLYQADVYSVGEGSRIDKVKHLNSSQTAYSEFIDDSFRINDLFNALQPRISNRDEISRIVLRASRELTYFIDQFIELLEASTSWDHRLTAFVNDFLSLNPIADDKNDISYHLIKRQLRFTIFFAVQAIREDSADVSMYWDDRKTILVESLRYIYSLYQNYYQLLIDLSAFQTMPPWDPEWIRQRIICRAAPSARR